MADEARTLDRLRNMAKTVIGVPLNSIAHQPTIAILVGVVPDLLDRLKEIITIAISFNLGNIHEDEATERAMRRIAALALGTADPAPTGNKAVDVAKKLYDEHNPPPFCPSVEQADVEELVRIVMADPNLKRDIEERTRPYRQKPQALDLALIKEPAPTVGQLVAKSRAARRALQRCPEHNTPLVNGRCPACDSPFGPDDEPDHG